MTALSSVLIRAVAVGAYAVFAASFAYLIGFLANFGVPKGIDHGLATPLPHAVAVDGLLIGLWALQHSVMARPAFKRTWTRIVTPSLERSAYVLASGVVLGVLYWGWRPMPAGVWHVELTALRGAIWALLAAGVGLVGLSSFSISHAELFGLRQAWAATRAGAEFRTPWLYRIVRHPLQAGVLVMLWSTPDMTVGHLLFAAGMTAYILVGLRFEERDLVVVFGDTYRDYQRRVPRLLPWPRPRARVRPEP